MPGAPGKAGFLMKQEDSPLVVNKDWRSLFPLSVLQKAENLVRTGRVKSFRCEDALASAQVEPRPGTLFSIAVEAPASFSDDWDSKRFSCSCLTKHCSTVCVKGRWEQRFVCHHEAAVLLAWEGEHGSWVFTEPADAYEARKQAEREKAEAKERERKRKEEKKRLQMEKERKENTKLEALSFFAGDDPQDSYFRFKKALAGIMTNQYAAENAAQLLKDDAVELSPPRLIYSHAGEQMLAADATVAQGNRSLDVTIHLHTERLSLHRCNCTANYYYIGRSELCAHELAVLAHLREYIRRKNPGDFTDRAACAFFEAMDSFSAEQAEQEPPAEAVRTRCIELRPKLLLGNDGALSLSYKIGRVGDKQMQLRSYPDFLNALENRGVFLLNKSLSLNFAEEELTEDSLPWLTFLQRRLSEAEVANSRLSNNYYYTPTIKAKTRDELIGAHLDRFSSSQRAAPSSSAGPTKAHLSFASGTPRCASRSSRSASRQTGRCAGCASRERCPSSSRAAPGAMSSAPTV